MVQIFEGPQKQSIGEMIGSAIGQGFGNSFNKGMDLNISQRLNEMLEEKQVARETAQRTREGYALAQGLGYPELGPVFAGAGPAGAKILIENMGAENLSKAMSEIMGMVGGESPQSMQQPQPRQQTPMNQPSPQQAQGMPQKQPFRGAPYKMPGQAQMSEGMQPNQAQQQLAPISEETPGVQSQPAPARKPMSDRDISDMIKKVPPKDRPALLRTLQEQKKFDLAQQKFENQKDVAERNLELSKAKFKHQQEQAEKDLALKHEAAIEKSYEPHKDFIDKTTNSYKAFESDLKPRLLQLQRLDDKDLVGPISSKFLDSLGIPLGALEDPSSELYNKVSQDLLKGLPETYGNKILLAEVENFLKTIPTLANSPEGRRMITSNMLKLGEMKEVFYNEMRRQQKQVLEAAEKFPQDFEQKVFDNVRPQIDRINSEFIKLSEIKHVPPNTVPFFGPQGDIVFVPKDPAALEWASQNGGKRVW